VKEGAIFCFFFLVGGPQGAYSARGGGGPKRGLYWGGPNVPKQLVMAQSIWPLQKKQKTKQNVSTHMN